MMRAEDVVEALVGMPGEADEAAGVFGDFVEGSGAFAFFRAELHAGDEAAEVLISRARLDEERVREAVGAGDFGADVRGDARLLRGEVEPRGAVDAVAVHDGHSGHVVLRAGAGQLLGVGCALEEGKSGAGVELYVHGGYKS